MCRCCVRELQWPDSWRVLPSTRPALLLGRDVPQDGATLRSVVFRSSALSVQVRISILRLTIRILHSMDLKTRSRQTRDQPLGSGREGQVEAKRYWLPCTISLCLLPPVHRPVGAVKVVTSSSLNSSHGIRPDSISVVRDEYLNRVGISIFYEQAICRTLCDLSNKIWQRSPTLS